jgi:hypothetical protein
MTKADVLQRLDAIRDESDRILELFDNGRRVPDAKVPEARELFRALKESLQAEYKRMATVKGQAALSEVEARLYWPAIQDAWANTLVGSARWNSRPDRRWHDSLCNVSSSMRHWIGDLRSVGKS